MKLNKHSVISILLAVFTFIINVISFFLLPDKIITQITFTGSSRNTSTILYLVLLSVLTSAAAGMSIYSEKNLAEKQPKWLTISIILTILNMAVIIYNLYSIK
jgi:uncharacterized membrane protein YidH (DUF202 family)